MIKTLKVSEWNSMGGKNGFSKKTSSLVWRMVCSVVHRQLTPRHLGPGEGAASPGHRLPSPQVHVIHFTRSPLACSKVYFVELLFSV